MAVPSLTVGVALGVPEATDFILDDATRGVLDGTSYTLATGYSTVTPDAFNVSITRGRFSRLWDSVDAGRCDIRLWNYDRDYDPAHSLSPYYGYVTPGRGVTIQAAGVDIFTGFVDDWDLDYQVDGVSSAVLKSTDALGVLGQMQFDAFTSSGVTADTKLSAVCDRAEVNWPGTLRQFDGGVEALQSDAVSWGSNVLNYVQLISRSDLGYLFAANDGVLTFRNRNVAVGAASAVSFSDTSGVYDSPLYGEDGEPLLDEAGIVITAEVDVVPFSGIRATLGSELLFARVGVDREGGTNQTATVADTTAWQDHYGPLRSLSIPGLLLNSDAQSLALAEYLLQLYGEPRYRISELTVDLERLNGAQQASVLALDITDTVDVTFTPDETGAAIMQTVVVQGIQHQISTERHTVTLSLIDAPFPFFILDDSVYGTLDENFLGF